MRAILYYSVLALIAVLSLQVDADFDDDDVGQQLNLAVLKLHVAVLPLKFRPQNSSANRAVRAYRPSLGQAACALASMPPWELDARVLARCTRHGRPQWHVGATAPGELAQIRRQAEEGLMGRWQLMLQSPTHGHRTLDALRPLLGDWASRKFGSLTFRLVQVLTGHGCFGKFLHRIRGEATPSCHECGAEVDTAQHTLQECLSWAQQRGTLTAAVGMDLSLPSVVRAMLGSDRSWQVVVSFCEEVISRKEAAERVREDQAHANSLRRRRGRTGRRRRAAC
ncbi:hypothetical protein evm_001474 [Chilo suppressalis]|nr:hypothetical protein evm_001474 [Chilo suppressalis]